MKHEAKALPLSLIKKKIVAHLIMKNQIRQITIQLGSNLLSSDGTLPNSPVSHLCQGEEAVAAMREQRHDFSEGALDTKLLQLLHPGHGKF